MCPYCRALVCRWQANLPRLDCEWPGRGCPRMDSRTPASAKLAEWDEKNRLQISLIADICARHHQEA